MDKKKLLLDYMKKFRLNCHYRFMFMPPEINEIPFHIYKDAYTEAKEEIKEEFKISQTEEKLIDTVYKEFIEKLKLTGDYNKADNIIVEKINKEN